MFFGGSYMTLQKLAKMTGVSVSTVSKAFSDSEEISRDTKKLVFKTAKSTGCFEKNEEAVSNISAYVLSFVR